MHAALVERALAAAHGPKIAELRQLEQAVDIAASAVEAADEDLQLEAGFDAGAWAELTKDVKPASSVPWLRKRGEQTVVVDLEARTERAASAEEIESGQFFSSFIEHQKANAA